MKGATRRPERARPDLASPLVASKLVPPVARPGTVTRTTLLDRLASETAPAIVSIVAPAGYGKTTLLRQWAEHKPRTSAWLTLNNDDNDPVVLLTYLAAALDRIIPVDPDVFRRLRVPQPSVHSITSMLGGTLASQELAGLIIDDVYVLENPDCHDIVGTLVEHVPAGTQIVAASRSELPLPVQRLRAQGRIIEIGPDDLALDHREAMSLLHGVGVELEESHVRELVAVTEGWAVPIYLAARSVKARGHGAGFDVAQVAEHRHVVAYVQAELLSTQPDETVEFLTRSALLDEMSGALCDAALMTTGSAQRLEAFAQSNLLVIPLDEHRHWYRYHHMFRGLLRAELALREPELVPEIHRRAGEWCHDNGLPDVAVGYAMAASDNDRAAEIVKQLAIPMYRVGRTVTLRRWFDWFDDHGLMGHHPEVALLGAWLSALTGHAMTAERWSNAAELAPLLGVLPDGTTPTETLQAIVRAGLCRHGVDRMLGDAETAERLTPSGSPFRPLVVLLTGIAHLLTGSLVRAEQLLAHAAEIGTDDGALPTASVALAEGALIAFGRGDHIEAHAMAERACAMVADGRLQDQATNALVFAVAARVAIHAGDVPRAMTLLAKAQRVRSGLTHALPFLAVQTRLELIHALLALADAPGARTVLREVDAILRLRPHLGVLPEQVEEVRARISRIPVGTIGSSSLTAAELRLLPLLQTHLTFGGIGERLYVSPHTVKTQAISIYRKLGVSSRSDAVNQARDLGLLSP
ncbi:MAG TPA: LuxR C-terminal-related transcriptional regulator [Euzebyales bacterium]|nr:LuxR C-terminal-related transcriptional regulator [Euzebyales bacterium]